MASQFRKDTLLSVLFFVLMGSSVSAGTLISHWQFLREDLSSPWEAFRPAKAGKPESVPLWTDVKVPHCWNAEDAVDPDANYYEGVGWYRTFLSIDNPYKEGRTVLHFQGTGQRAKVYVYRQWVASHIGGYDEWEADITEAVAAFRKDTATVRRFNGRIPIAVRCDNSRDVETIPSDMSDFTIYGGIYRPVELFYRPKHYIGLFHLTPEVKTGLIRCDIRLSVPTTGQIEFYVKSGKSGKNVAHTSWPLNGQKCLTVGLKVKKPELWSTDNPNLYTVHAILTTGGDRDEVSEQTGFRGFRFADHGPFFLNGKRLLLQGTHRHEDHAGVGAAVPDSVTLREMRMIKDMGANFIRLAHYQQSERVLDLCDSLGILVWEEIPWCRGGLGGDRYKAQAKRMLANMIAQHYNHPSVILWGLGNENDWPGDFDTFNKDSIRAFMSELNEEAHTLDPSRKTVIRRCEFCSDIPDVYSPSIWPGWYSGNMRDYRSMTERAINRYPHFLHAEWGGDSHAGRHAEGDVTNIDRGDANGDWSETYMVNLFDWVLHEQQTMPNLTGTAFWTFKDFATPLRPDNPIPYVNQKGVVERDLTPKESFFVFQAYWAKKPMVHIYGHSWPIRWGKAGEERQVFVYSNCRSAELFVNGVSMGARKRDARRFPAMGLVWNVKYKPGRNTLKVVTSAGLSDSITQYYETRQWGEPVRMEMQLKQIKDDEWLFSVQLCDAKGVPCLDARNWITFSAAGNARLIDNMGTNTGSRRIQAANGRASIKVRLSGKEPVVAAVCGKMVAIMK